MPISEIDERIMRRDVRDSVSRGVRVASVNVEALQQVLDELDELRAQAVTEQTNE